MDYTASLVSDPMTLIIGTSSGEALSHINMTAYLEVLRKDTWVAALASALAVALVYALIVKRDSSSVWKRYLGGLAFFGRNFLQLSSYDEREEGNHQGYSSVARRLSFKIFFLSSTCTCFMTYQVE